MLIFYSVGVFLTKKALTLTQGDSGEYNEVILVVQRGSFLGTSWRWLSTGRTSAGHTSFIRLCHARSVRRRRGGGVPCCVVRYSLLR